MLIVIQNGKGWEQKVWALNKQNLFVEKNGGRKSLRFHKHPLVAKTKETWIVQIGLTTKQLAHNKNSF